MESIKQVKPSAAINPSAWSEGEEEEESDCDCDKTNLYLLLPLELKLLQLEVVLQLAETWLSIQTIAEVKKGARISDFRRNQKKGKSRIGRSSQEAEYSSDEDEEED